MADGCAMTLRSYVDVLWSSEMVNWNLFTQPQNSMSLSLSKILGC